MKKPTVNMTSLADALSSPPPPITTQRISLDKIHPDPHQIRQTRITTYDIMRGHLLSDPPPSEAQQKEFEEIKDLASTLLESGLLAPPIAYALPGGEYCLIAGERRFLAALFAATHLHLDAIIDAKIYPSKPQQETIDNIQFTENMQRKNLSLYESTSWVMRRLDHFKETHRKAANAADIQALLSVRKSQAYLYKALHESSPERRNHLLGMARDGEITNLKKLCDADAQLAAVEPLNHETGEQDGALGVEKTDPAPPQKPCDIRVSLPPDVRNRFLKVCKSQKINAYDVLRAYIKHYGDQGKLF